MLDWLQETFSIFKLKSYFPYFLHFKATNARILPHRCCSAPPAGHLFGKLVRIIMILNGTLRWSTLLLLLLFSL